MEKADKRADILKAAEQLFAEYGYEATSTRQIAKESGANMAMINYYFGGKMGVFVEIMEERVASFKTQLNLIHDDQVPVLDKLMKVIEQYAERIVGSYSFHRMMHRELSFSSLRPEIFEKIKEAMRQNLLVIERIIEQGINEGVFRPVDIRMTIITIMGTISMVTNSPSKIAPDNDIDLSKKQHREEIKKRVITHLKDLMLTYLIKPKNDTI